MTSAFCCPHCGSALEKADNQYKCPSNHCFDVSKQGYVNLLVSNKSTSLSGDDKEMVKARTRFLDAGFYAPLRDELCAVLQQAEYEKGLIIDSGCGEGYYTFGFLHALSEKGVRVSGIDISKSAIKHAAKRCADAEFAVASAYHLPYSDECADAVINCFSPAASDEFCRVLRKGGLFIYVVPGAAHLWELKSILYDSPYKNEEKTESYEGFEFLKAIPVSTSFTLEGNDKILDLFHMTPYTWNTPREGARRLENIESLFVRAEFFIHIYRKK